MADTPDPNDGNNGGNAPQNISPADAAKLLEAPVRALQQRWIQLAVRIAGAQQSGQPVSTGTFADLKKFREEYEELERARLFLRNVTEAKGS